MFARDAHTIIGKTAVSFQCPDCGGKVVVVYDGYELGKDEKLVSIQARADAEGGVQTAVVYAKCKSCKNKGVNYLRRVK